MQLTFENLPSIQ